MARVVTYNGVNHNFPDDFDDEQISKALKQYDQETKNTGQTGVEQAQPTGKVWQGAIPEALGGLKKLYDVTAGRAAQAYSESPMAEGLSQELGTTYDYLTQGDKWGVAGNRQAQRLADETSLPVQASNLRQERYDAAVGQAQNEHLGTLPPPISGVPGVAPQQPYVDPNDPAIQTRAMDILTEQKAARDMESENDRRQIGRVATAIYARQDLSDSEKAAETEKAIQEQQAATHGKEMSEMFAAGRRVAGQHARDGADEIAAIEAGRQAMISHVTMLLQTSKGREATGVADQNTATYENFLKTLTDGKEFSRMLLQTGIPMALAYGTGAAGVAGLTRLAIQIYGTTASTALIQKMYDGEVDWQDAMREGVLESAEIPAMDALRGANRLAGITKAPGLLGQARSALSRSAGAGLAELPEEVMQEVVGTGIGEHRMMSGPEIGSVAAHAAMMGSAMGPILHDEGRLITSHLRIQAAKEAGQRYNAYLENQAGMIAQFPKEMSALALGHMQALPEDLETRVQLEGLRRAEEEGTAESPQAVAQHASEARQEVHEAIDSAQERATAEAAQGVEAAKPQNMLEVVQQQAQKTVDAMPEESEDESKPEAAKGKKDSAVPPISMGGITIQPGGIAGKMAGRAVAGLVLGPFMPAWMAWPVKIAAGEVGRAVGKAAEVAARRQMKKDQITDPALSPEVPVDPRMASTLQASPPAVDAAIPTEGMEVAPGMSASLPTMSLPAPPSRRSEAPPVAPTETTPDETPTEEEGPDPEVVTGLKEKFPRGAQSKTEYEAMINDMALRITSGRTVPTPRPVRPSKPSKPTPKRPETGIPGVTGQMLIDIAKRTALGGQAAPATTTPVVPPTSPVTPVAPPPVAPPTTPVTPSKPTKPSKAYPEGVTDDDVTSHPVFTEVMDKFALPDDHADVLRSSSGQIIKSAKQARAIARSMAAKAIKQGLNKTAQDDMTAASHEEQVQKLIPRVTAALNDKKVAKLVTAKNTNAAKARIRSLLADTGATDKAVIEAIGTVLEGEKAPPTVPDSSTNVPDSSTPAAPSKPAEPKWYHKDHSLKTTHTKAAEKALAGKKPGFHIIPVKVKSKLPSTLYGPKAGDPAVTEAEVVYQKRGDREEPSRMIRRPTRPSDTMTVIGMKNEDGSVEIYTAYGGPLAPKETGDPALKDEEREESKKFWSEHALATGETPIDIVKDKLTEKPTEKAPQKAPEGPQEARQQPLKDRGEQPVRKAGKARSEAIPEIKAFLEASEFEKAAALAKEISTTPLDRKDTKGRKVGFVTPEGHIIMNIDEDGMPSTLKAPPRSSTASARQGTGRQYSATKAEGDFKSFRTGSGETLRQMFVQNVYKGSTPGETWVKEVLQNVLDAFDMKRDTEGNQDFVGKATITYNSEKGTLKATDNGIGMDPEFMEKHFLNPGDSGKREGALRGNFGIAKLAILGIGTDFKVTSTFKRKDGSIVKTVVKGNQKDWLSSDPKAEISTPVIMPEGTATGTTFEVDIDQDFVGDEGIKPSHFIHYMKAAMGTPMVTDNVRTVIDGETVKIQKGMDWRPHYGAEEKAKGEGDWFENEAWKNKTVIETDDATYEIYTPKVNKYNSAAGGKVRVALYNRGQLQSNRYDNDMGVSVDKGIEGLPDNIIVNVLAKVAGTNAKYPWTFDRKNLQQNGKDIISEYLNDKLVTANKNTKTKYQDAEDNAPKVPRTATKGKDGGKTPVRVMTPEHKSEQSKDLAREISRSDSAAAVAKALVKVGQVYLEHMDPMEGVVFHLGYSDSWYGVNAPGNWYPDGRNRILLNPWTSILRIGSDSQVDIAEVGDAKKGPLLSRLSKYSLPFQGAVNDFITAGDLSGLHDLVEDNVVGIADSASVSEKSVLSNIDKYIDKHIAAVEAGLDEDGYVGYGEITTVISETVNDLNVQYGYQPIYGNLRDAVDARLGERYSDDEGLSAQDQALIEAIVAKPDVAATVMASTILHEIAHEKARGHDVEFAAELTKAAARGLLIGSGGYKPLAAILKNRAIVKELIKHARKFEDLPTEYDQDDFAGAVAHPAQGVREGLEEGSARTQADIGREGARPSSSAATPLVLSTQKASATQKKAQKAFLDDFQQGGSVNPLNKKQIVVNGVKVTLVPQDDGTVELHDLESTETGRGAGSAVLRDILTLADKHGVTIVGFAFPYGPNKMSIRKLRQWYTNNGFKVSETGDMVYQPKVKKKFSAKKKAPASDLDDMGLYSQLERQIRSLKQEKQPGEYWLRMLKKQKRQIKHDETLWSGVDKYLKDNRLRSISKDELISLMQQGFLKLEQRSLVHFNAPGQGAGNQSRTLRPFNKGAQTPSWSKSNYVTKGGRNHRELVVTVPVELTPDAFKYESHYPDKNIVFHIRVNDRDGVEEANEKKRSIGDVNREFGEKGRALDTRYNRMLSEFRDQSDLPPGASWSEGMRAYKAKGGDTFNKIAEERLDLKEWRNSEIGGLHEARPRVLHVDEIQSDWAEQGRDRGFKKDTPNLVKIERELIELHRKRNIIDDGLEVFHAEMIQKYIVDKDPDASDVTWINMGPQGRRDLVKEFNPQDDAYHRAEIQKSAEFNSSIQILNVEIEVAQQKRVPRAPWVMHTEAWAELAVKRILTLAAREGYAEVSFTTGDAQLRRYSGLTSQIQQVTAKRQKNGMVILEGYKKGARSPGVSERISESEMESYIGKAAAAKLVKKMDAIEAAKNRKPRKVRPPKPDAFPSIGTVRVPMLDEMKDVPAWDPGVPGLVLAQAEGDGSFSVTHKQTGVSLGVRTYKLESAGEAARRIQEKFPDIDWTKKLPVEDNYRGQPIPDSSTLASKERLHEMAIFTRSLDAELKGTKPRKKAVPKDVASISGGEMTIGKHGMRDFYDRLIPGLFMKVGRELGLETQLGQIPAGLTKGGNLKKEEAHTLKISPEARDKIAAQGFPRFSVAKGAKAEGAAMTVEAIKAQLPPDLAENLTRDDETGHFLIETPRGTIRIKPVDQVEVDDAALIDGWGPDAPALYRRGEIEIEGATYVVNGEAVIELVRSGALPHELAGHVYLDHFATKREKRILNKKFQSKIDSGEYHDMDEAISDSVREVFKRLKSKPGWQPTNVIGRFAKRIHDFYQGAFRAMFPNADSILVGMAKGKVFARKPGKTDDTGLVAPQYAKKKAKQKAVDTSSTAFRNWFGKSVLTDKGKPVTLYHGTSKDKDFDSFRAGTRGIFVTTSAKEAGAYAETNDSQSYDLRERKSKNAAPRVMPLYVRLENPYKPTKAEFEKYKFAKSYASAQRDLAWIAEKKGHDGIDMGGGTYVVFDKNQVKSAISNTGEFGPGGRIQFEAIDPKGPGFKGWFKKSHARDVDGAPLTLYHGTDAAFDTFKMDEERPMIWASTDPEHAGIYVERLTRTYPTPSEREANQMELGKPWKDRAPGGNIMPLYMSIQNPVMVEGDATEDMSWDDLVKQTFYFKLPKLVQTRVGDYGAGISAPLAWFITSQEFIAEAKKRGYDGIAVDEGFYGEGVEGSNEHALTFAAFEKNQVKSALGNTGDFSLEDDRITYSAGPRDAGSALGRQLKAAQGLRKGRKAIKGALERKTDLTPRLGGPKMVADTGDAVAPIKYSVATAKATTAAAKAKNAKDEVFTDAQIKKFEKDITNVTAIVLSDPSRYGYTALRGATPIKGNGDKRYPKSLDFTTMCRRRYVLSDTVDRVQSNLGRILEAEEIIAIRDRLENIGHEVNCGPCYVESRRYNMKTAIDKARDGYVDNREGATKGKTLRLKPKWRTAVETQAGRDRMFEQAPDQYKIFSKAFAGTQIKVPIGRAEYGGEILSLRQDTVDKMNRYSGLRSQSWSDFEVPHLIDKMQAVFDMSVRKLKGQSYTKEIEYVETMKDTGEMVNMSLIPIGIGLDANGKLIFKENESIRDMKRARAIRAAYNNVGFEIIGINDEHIIAALADSEIDYVIPYHSSGLKEEYKRIGGMRGWIDYTKEQHWTDQNGEEIDVSEEIFVDEWQGDLKKLKKLIDQKKLKPPFHDRFGFGRKGGPVKGYEKLLTDRRIWGNDGKFVVQQPVTPTFDMKYINKMLKGYGGGHNQPQGDQSVVDEFSLSKQSGTTAMPRKGVSAPGAAILGELGNFLGRTVIDWGGGLGEDAKAYGKTAKKVQMYDLNHQPVKPKGKADFVTNTYVANVIEPEGRHAMWKEAFSHAKEAMIVSVRTDKVEGREFKDGVITKGKKTFQKIYKADELIAELRKVFPDATVEKWAGKTPSGAAMAIVRRKKGRLS